MTPEEAAADEEFSRRMTEIDNAREAIRHVPDGTAQYMLDVALRECAYDPFAMLLTLDPDGLLHVVRRTIWRPAGAEPPRYGDWKTRAERRAGTPVPHPDTVAS